MLLETIQSIFGLFLLFIMMIAVWESSKMVSEKKYRQRKGLTDYYDNPIKKNKCMGGEDE